MNVMYYILFEFMVVVKYFNFLFYKYLRVPANIREY